MAHTLLLLQGPPLPGVEVDFSHQEALVRTVLEPHALTCEGMYAETEQPLIDWLHAQRAASFVIANLGQLATPEGRLGAELTDLGFPVFEIQDRAVPRSEGPPPTAFPQAVGCLAGLGSRAYSLAAQFAVDWLTTSYPAE